MKSVKLSQPFFLVDRHYEPGQVVTVADEVANQLARSGGGEVVDGGQVANADANPLHDAVDPLVPNADPLHAARALGMAVDQHPGLVALAANVQDSPALAELPEAVDKKRRLKTVATTQPAVEPFTDTPKGD